MVHISMFLVGASVLFGPGLGLRKGRKSVASRNSCSSLGCGIAYNQSAACQCNTACPQYGNCCDDYQSYCEDPPPVDSCRAIGCGTAYSSSLPCQCNSRCPQYGNCCEDFATQCSAGGPAPAPPPSPPSSCSGACYSYWSGVNKNDAGALKRRMRGARKLSYTPGVWKAFKNVWVNLPGVGCPYSKIYDVYSNKCWTEGGWNGGQQCKGTAYSEGECYNREHSWPKSWWGGAASTPAYTDLFHIFPSDAYVNKIRSNYPFGEVRNPTFVSAEGNKRGPCSTPGYSGTCFEPTDRVKGLMARAFLYMDVRYRNEFSCCDKDAVEYDMMKPWTLSLMLKWNAAHAPAGWEKELNNRAQKAQGNRNPFIDFPELAQTIFG